MTSFAKPIVLVALVAIASPVRAQLRLEGLDRLYFEKVAAAGRKLPATLAVARLLPDTLSQPGAGAKLAGATDLILVHDVLLPLGRRTPPIWIREITDHGHPRIAELWWALYDGGRRSDVWHFTAMPDRTGNKMLGNYTLEDISAKSPGEALFRVRSEMFRPQGIWWIAGKVLTFTITDRAIEFARVLNVFTLSQGYDIGDTPPDLSASTERETATGFEARTVDTVSKTLQRECGYQNPLLDDDADLAWAKLDAVARCITSKLGAAIAIRDRHAPSFIERGK